MPPKEKVSKVRVTDTAFEMTREYGFTAVTARKLAEQLGCSTQPIFRAYENMEELRAELYFMSVQYFSERIIAKKKSKQPLYIVLAMSYIELAKEEKYLFELIASTDDFGSRTIEEFLTSDEWAQIVDKLPGMEDRSFEDKREVFMMLWMFVHGLASLIVSNRISVTDKKIKELLTKAYEGFVG